MSNRQYVKGDLVAAKLRPADVVSYAVWVKVKTGVDEDIRDRVYYGVIDNVRQNLNSKDVLDGR